MITSVSNQWGYDYADDKIFRVKNGSKVTYTIGNLLGKGATAKVFELVPDNPQKRIKAIKITTGWATGPMLDNEFDKLLSLTNEGQPIGIQLKPKAKITFANKNMVIFPKYDCSLDQLEEKKIVLAADQIADAARQMIEGLYFLYQQDYFVSDIGAGNTFYRVKKGVCRFDLSDLSFLRKESFADAEKKQEFYRKGVNSIGQVILEMNGKGLSPEFKSVLKDMCAWGREASELEKIKVKMALMK